MSLCMACGGKRENNILRHKETCAFHVQTAKAAEEARRNDERRAERERVDANAKPEKIRMDYPELAALEVELDDLYPQ